MRMAEYIDREALIKDVEESKFRNYHCDAKVYLTHKHEHDHFLRLIDIQPAADVAPVVHGRWHTGYVDKANKKTGVECFECSAFFNLSLFDFGLAYNFCPNCGAKMDGGGGDGV